MHAVAVSPPPITDTAPSLVTSTMVCILGRLVVDCVFGGERHVAELGAVCDL